MTFDPGPRVVRGARSVRRSGAACGLDSMDFLNLMIALHDATGVDVPERDDPQLMTIEGAVDYVSTRS
jgi:acyl carrier protein